MPPLFICSSSFDAQSRKATKLEAAELEVWCVGWKEIIGVWGGGGSVKRTNWSMKVNKQSLSADSVCPPYQELCQE